jgi:hypothetical protein
MADRAYHIRGHIDGSVVDLADPVSAASSAGAVRSDIGCADAEQK